MVFFWRYDLAVCIDLRCVDCFDRLGIFQKEINNNTYELLIKNKILLNDEIQIITPNYSTLAKVIKIEHNKKGEVDTANTNDEINIAAIRFFKFQIPIIYNSMDC